MATKQKDQSGALPFPSIEELMRAQASALWKIRASWAETSGLRKSRLTTSWRRFASGGARWAERLIDLVIDLRAQNEHRHVSGDRLTALSNGGSMVKILASLAKR